jgi:hypothetical protein
VQIHEKQLEELNKWIQNRLDMNRNEEIEHELASKQECFV